MDYRNFLSLSTLSLPHKHSMGKDSCKPLFSPCLVSEKVGLEKLIGPCICTFFLVEVNRITGENNLIIQITFRNQTNLYIWAFTYNTSSFRYFYPSASAILKIYCVGCGWLQAISFTIPFTFILYSPQFYLIFPYPYNFVYWILEET